MDTPARALSALARALASKGHDVVLRRYSGLGEARTATDLTVRSFARGYRHEDAGGGVVQGETTFVMSPGLVAEENWPVIGDFIVWQGRERRISMVQRIEMQGEAVRLDVRAEG